MNRIEQLLAELCPDGVEFKALEEITELRRGRRLVKNELSAIGRYAVYQNSMTPLGYYHENNVNPDTTFIISAGAAGEIGYSDVAFWAADDVYFFLGIDFLLSKFLYYFFLTQKNKILTKVRRASIPRLSKSVIEKIYIPIPPLAIQKEIVKILDKFVELQTSLQTELQEELQKRKIQYEYYRNALLTFPGSGERGAGSG